MDEAKRQHVRSLSPTPAALVHGMTKVLTGVVPQITRHLRMTTAAHGAAGEVIDVCGASTDRPDDRAWLIVAYEMFALLREHGGACARRLAAMRDAALRSIALGWLNDGGAEVLPRDRLISAGISLVMATHTGRHRSGTARARETPEEGLG